MRVDPDEYQCRHGLGYSIIKGVKNNLEVEVRYFIPLGFDTEIWQVKIRNHSKNRKSIRLWGLVEWCLWDALDDMTNFQRNYSIGQVEVEKQAIFHVTEYRERRNHFAYFACSHPTTGFDTSRDAFIGVHRGFDAPQAILDGACKNSITHGWVPLGVHQLDLNLESNATETFHFLLGYAENPIDQKFQSSKVVNKAPFEKIFKHFNEPGSVETAFEMLKVYWSKLLSIYQVETDIPVVNRMVNIWNQYQCMVTFNLSRAASLYESGVGRGMGYRDSNQDILGFVHLIPDRARQRILDLAATQLSDGTCFHQYQPLTKKGNENAGSSFNDDPLWLILSTAAYLKETGDFTILNEKVGYADQAEKQTNLLDHLEISIRYTLNHRGPHGLPLIGHADWNDCLNLNCFSETPGESFQLAGDMTKSDVAESVMIAGLFCAACDEMVAIYQKVNQPDRVQLMQDNAQKMRTVILKHGWDGEWFLRAYDALGRKIGSKENIEGKIFIESQGWCILGGVGIEDGLAQKALDSVNKHLATPNGIVLQQPAYQTYHRHLGEISSYPPGYKENAGIFTHNNIWIQIAETILGRGAAAFKYYLSICPPMKETQIETYRAEPYIYSQMTAGPDAPTSGEGKNAWLTGTVAWSFVAISQYILGIRPGLDGLIIDPCIPPDWKKYSVKRIYRGTIYQIQVENPEGISKGVKNIEVDGKIISGQVLPLFHDGKEHVVNVRMG
jgi:cellobiose phosphorylase